MAMTPFLLHHFLQQSAQCYPERWCLIEENDRATYADVLSGACRIANSLLHYGLQKGDRVALMAYNSRFFVESYFGVLMAGGVVVAINTAADARMIGVLLNDCSARMLIVGHGSQRAVRGALADMVDLEVLFVEGPLRLKGAPAHIRGLDLLAERELAATSPPNVGLIDQDLACIIYTSGSTGRPRGAMLTHLGCVSNTRAVQRYLRLTVDDSVLAVLPFYYIYGKSVLDTHVASGATVVIENRFLYPQLALDTLEAQGCTGFSGVPSSFAILLNRSNFAERKFSTLRYVTQAGGAMSPALTRRLMEAIPDKEVFVMYGATEASGRLTYVPSNDLHNAIGTIGRAIDNVDLRALRADGTVCDVGEEGELVARGSCIMKGYWGDPGETAAVLDGNGYHTGDLGMQREDGYFTVVGRSKDMIKSAAHRISPKEIEEAILEHPMAHEAAVIGIPDEFLGESIKAFVVAKDASLDVDELTAFLGKRLPSYKVPQSIEVRDALPKNPSGKIMKQPLREEERVKAAGRNREDHDAA